MEQGNLIALPLTGWKKEYVEDTSLRDLVLGYYDREHVAILRYLSFLNVDRETAQEIVQETFLKLHEHLLADGDRANLRAWLYRVAHNLTRNVQKAAHAARTDSLELAAGHDEPADSASPEQEFLEQERLERLRRAVCELSPAQSQCLVLRAEGLKYREIADVLELSISTVGENVQRALERLRQIL